MEVVGKTVSADMLVEQFNKFADEYDSDYPEVNNPSALIEGTNAVLRVIGNGQIYDNTLIYIIENEYDLANPNSCRYIIMVTKGHETIGETDRFAIKLFYNETGELESISTFEDNKVVWSPDKLSNSLHPLRTKYYMGFTYMLCEKSPGFQDEITPEKEMSVQELIAIGVEGELPADLITIDVEETETKTESEQKEVTATITTSETFEETVEPTIEEEETEEDYATILENEIANLFDESVFEDTQEQAEEDVQDDFIEEESESEDSYEDQVTEDIQDEEDDTEVVIVSPEDYEDEYDDLETDYEELFE